MLNIFKNYHKITNFPKNYPTHKKIIANAIFLLTGLLVNPRTNQLSSQDLFKANLILKKGDVLLAGNLKTLLHKIIREPVTHSGLYIGNKKFIHSRGNGVQLITLDQIFMEYDTLIIMRVPSNLKNKKKIIKKAINFAISQNGKPYNFDFKAGSRSFFCTQLVNNSYKYAGFNSGLKSIKRSNKAIKKLKENFIGAVDALHPINFLKSKFCLVYLSHNLKFDKNKIVYSAPILPLKNKLTVIR
jgi:hypothetical protein